MKNDTGTSHGVGRHLSVMALTILIAASGHAFAASAAAGKDKLPPASERAAATLAAIQPVPVPASPPAPLSADPAKLGPDMDLFIGKSTLLRLPDPVDRISVGNPSIADVTAISAREIYLIGKDLGTTNVIVWAKSGQATVIDVRVRADPSLLKAELSVLLPGEKDIKVHTSADSIVLTGIVSDAVKAQQAADIAQAWVRRLTRSLVLPVSVGEQPKGTTTIQLGANQNSMQQTARVAGPAVINMLRVRAAMQVMLEVKVAEISKTLLNKLGMTSSINHTSGSFAYDILSKSSFFNQLLGSASLIKGSQYGIQLDAQSDNGLVKLLAEPNIMAISGQEASFRAGGKIFIPVARANNVTGTTITLEEKEFGVGLKFKPTVLEGTRINLQVSPEVSELQQGGTPFATVGGVTSVLPSFTLRRAETTVQLNDGQSFMIAGLVQNNVTQTINRFPGLGDIPILGALFRSTDFQTDKTELMFVITPRLVKPLPENYALPTDQFIEPSAADLFLNGQMEGAAPAPVSSADAASGGFEMK